MSKTKKEAWAVIGAGYGDEGKGLMTDYLASKGADVVVRSNGGAQAGHSVQTTSGERHVFHHFPSGAMAGVRGHLSSHFVSHPMMFMPERAELQSKGANVTISADPRGIVTTPWDVMLNQFIENRRGDKRHGSCGMGFGEAIERSLRPQFKVTVGNLLERDNIEDILVGIREEWVAKRLLVLGGGDLTDEETILVGNDAILERFVSDCASFAETVDLLDDKNLAGSIVFEGAQGLMLDQDYGAFPFVTRSNTGIRNMSTIAAEAGIDHIKAFYMTRAYVTRHGAGPLDHSEEKLEFINMIDPTNVPNDWQGTLRAAPLDAAVLGNAVSQDLTTSAVSVEAGIVVTCLDQIVSEARIHDGYNWVAVDGHELVKEVETVCHRIFGTSWGPTRETVKVPEAA